MTEPIEVVCPECGMVLRHFGGLKQLACNCGAVLWWWVLKSKWVSYRCPKCGRPFSDHKRYTCPHCGVGLTWDFDDGKWIESGDEPFVMQESEKPKPNLKPVESAPKKPCRIIEL